MSRRQSHMMREKESINQSFEIDTSRDPATFNNDKHVSCHELRVLPIQTRPTQTPAVSSPLPLNHPDSVALQPNQLQHLRPVDPQPSRQASTQLYASRSLSTSTFQVPHRAPNPSKPLPTSTLSLVIQDPLPGSLLPLSPPGNTTRSIVDIISEFNEKSEEEKGGRETCKEVNQDIDYLQWVSESSQQPPSKLTPTDSCSSTQSGGSNSRSNSSTSTSSKEKQRASSPDSGCDMSGMVAYTTEPKVRRPDVCNPTPVPRQSLKKTSSQPTRPKSVLVTDIEHPEKETTKAKKLHRNSSYELSCPYSRAGIYSIEGSRLQEQLEQDNSEQEFSDSGQGSSILSSSTKLRSYASSRDIVEMYGNGSGQPLTPRMLGFSSSDLRLPPSTLLLSLAGKKSNSSLSVHWPPPSGGGAAVYQNIPRRTERDTVF